MRMRKLNHGIESTGATFLFKLDARGQNNCLNSGVGHWQKILTGSCCHADPQYSGKNSWPFQVQFRFLFVLGRRLKIRLVKRVMLRWTRRPS